MGHDLSELLKQPAEGSSDTYLLYDGHSNVQYVSVDPYGFLFLLQHSKANDPWKKKRMNMLYIYYVIDFICSSFVGHVQLDLSHLVNQALTYQVIRHWQNGSTSWLCALGDALILY